MPLQDWIHHWGEGAGSRVVRALAALLAFIAIAGLYDQFTIYNSLSPACYSSEEAMETAQLARNLAQGKGYTTDSIRPIALSLLAGGAETGQSSKVLAKPIPDLTTPPAYPWLLSGLMKELPFQFTTKEFWAYQPDRWICVFNQALFLACAVLVFLLARKMFDSKVAWLAAGLFGATHLFWRFSLSGLSTLWVILVFLSMLLCMTEIERRARVATAGAGYKLLPLAVLTGALVGVGGLSRYAFAWMIAPVFLFVLLGVERGRIKLSLTVMVAFLAVMAPWIQRNVKLTGHPFGTADYAVVQGTAQFPQDTLERSVDLTRGFKHLEPMDVFNKLLSNLGEICANELPKLGGNWISAFFFAGLLIPYRNPGLSRLRWFAVGSLVLLVFVQALTATHLSTDVPQINSENLLALLAPLIFIYGAAFFHTLLDQLHLPPADVHATIVWCFATILCLPLLFAMLAARAPVASSPYSPLHLQQTGRMMQTNEVLMSDVPSGMAWYGQRPCVWLSLDDENEFFKVSAFKPIQALFLTQVTTEKRFLSQMKSDPKSWGHFVLECSEHSEVPTGFSLRKAPVGLLPEQLFLSDRDRWQEFKAQQ